MQPQLPQQHQLPQEAEPKPKSRKEKSAEMRRKRSRRLTTPGIVAEPGSSLLNRKLANPRTAFNDCDGGRGEDDGASTAMLRLLLEVPGLRGGGLRYHALVEFESETLLGSKAAGRW